MIADRRPSYRPDDDEHSPGPFSDNVVTEHESQATVRLWAVKVVGEDAFMYSSQDEQETRRWLARLNGDGRTVELVTCERHSNTYWRFTEWVPASAANDGSHAHG